MTQELAEKILKSAEELIEADEAQEKLLNALSEAEQLLPDDVSILCRSARLLFRYGILNSKCSFFLLALDKLTIAEEKKIFFLDGHPIWWQLWGNILVQLGKVMNDISFFEKAMVKYQRAARFAKGSMPELFWDWGEAWILIALKSGEPTDFQQGLALFYRAQQEGVTSIFFRLDFASSFTHYCHISGDPKYLEEAFALFQGVIADAYSPDKESSVAYALAWRKYALALKLRYQLTHQHDHLERADAALQQAILVSSKNKELWLDWGELYLSAGWLKRKFNFLELGLEKLTASKIKESDPMRVSYLLSMGLLMFGLFLENLKLLKDGQARIRDALLIAPQHPQLLFASAFSDLCLGLYFSDETYFSKACSLLEKETMSPEHLHALFQAYAAWGFKTGDISILKKGIRTIARLCEIRPFSMTFLNEWGVALLRLRQLETDVEFSQAYIEEAIDKFRKASNLGENEETLYNWGCALDLLGDLTANEEDYLTAIDFLTRAFEKQPGELPIRFHLGLAFSHLGELTLNADYLKQAIEYIEMVAKIEQEDERAWCELGYVHLNLAGLAFDPLQEEEGKKIRSEAERALMQAAKLGSGVAYYYLACLYSLSSLYTASLHYLKKAKEVNHLPPLEDLEQDEWLEGLRKTEAFQKFLIQEKNG